MSVFSARLDEALSFAARAHAPHTRKGTDIPYIIHPVHIAIMLLKHGCDEELIVAALLHDVAEDAQVSLDEIGARFGARVASLVGELTQPQPESTGRSWREVRAAAIDHLATASPGAVLLKCADTLHNTAALLEDIRRRGKAALSRFKRPPGEQLWYYGGVAEQCGRRLGMEHALARELDETIRALRASIQSPASGS